MISIVVATYNRKKLLPRCLDSLLSQTYSDFEIIVVDDGSVDGTEEIFKSSYTDKRIRYFKFPENQGVAAARDFGIEQSRGDYLMIWDSDDTLYPNALEELINVFSDYLDIDIVSAPTVFVERDKEIILEEVSSRSIPYVDNIKYGTPPGTRIILFKRKVLGNTRFEVPNLDFIFYKIIAKRGKWYHLNKKLGIQYRFSDVWSLTKNRRKANPELSVQRALRLNRYLNEYRDDWIKYNPTKYSGLCYGASVGLLLARKKQQALIYAKEALRHNLKRIRNWFWYFFVHLPLSEQIIIFLFKLRVINKILCHAKRFNFFKRLKYIDRK